MQRIPSATRDLSNEVSQVLTQLKPGDRVRLTQRVRVGSTATWQAPVEGSFRHFNHLATGIATDRIPEDDIIVVCVHFTKDNGEMSSITVDEHCKIEKI